MAELQILNDQHPAVQYLCKKDKRLAKLARRTIYVLGKE